MRGVGLLLVLCLLRRGVVRGLLRRGGGASEGTIEKRKGMERVSMGRNLSFLRLEMVESLA